VLLSALFVAAASCGSTVGSDGSGTDVTTVCTTSPGALHHDLSVPGHEWRLSPHCAIGGSVVCAGGAVCGDTDPPGTVYDVFEDGELVSEVCLTPAEHLAIDQPWPGDVEDAVAHQDWPAPVLRIQPVGGRTLVNLPTNFYTRSTSSHVATVVLLGYTTTITLTPVSYTWHYGDGAERTTVSAGDAYPAMPLTHTYETSGRTVQPSVDETFRVSYAFAGGGGTLDNPVTERGGRQGLTILTATPHLMPWD